MSVAQRRRRPRVRSLSWRVFAWVLCREAAVNVLMGHEYGRAPDLRVRFMLRPLTRAQVLGLARRRSAAIARSERHPWSRH